jgi:hypothetical protein
MFREQAQIGLKGRQHLHGVECRSSSSAKTSGSAFSVPPRSFVRPIRDVGPERGDRRPPRCYRERGRGTFAPGRLTVSPWKCARMLKALNLNHRQIVEAPLIRVEAIGRTEPHTEVAMKDQAERFPTVIASHAFNMRRTWSLALDLRSPFPRLRKTNSKAFGGFPTNPAVETASPLGTNAYRASRLSSRQARNDFESPELERRGGRAA